MAETSSTIHQMHAIKVQGIQGIQEGDGVPVVWKGTTERAEEAHPIVLEANGNDDGVHGDGVQKESKRFNQIPSRFQSSIGCLCI